MTTTSGQRKEVLDWLLQRDNAPVRRDHPFLEDMVDALSRYGQLTERQYNATEKFYERSREQAAAASKDKRPPLQEGSRTLSGMVLSTKWQQSRFGTALKMLVELEDKNRVYGSVPRTLLESMEEEDFPGTPIRFTATVTRSDSDPHFGFFSRPRVL